MSLIPANADGVLETRTERFWVHPDGYVVAEVKPNLVADLDDAVVNVAAVEVVAGRAPVPLLLDMRAHAAQATRECRAYFAGPEAAKVNLAVAMLVRSNISRILGNFFIGINKTPFPLRLFSEEVEAIAWLCEQARDAQMRNQRSGGHA